MMKKTPLTDLSPEMMKMVKTTPLPYPSDIPEMLEGLATWEEKLQKIINSHDENKCKCAKQAKISLAFIAEYRKKLNVGNS